MKKLDLTDQRFGRLVVLEEAEAHVSPSNRRRRQWLCMCDCGNKVIIIQHALTQQKSQSCGCLKREVSKKQQTKHDMSQKRQYYIWKSMKARCSNEKATDYPYYGGSGISYDPKWSTFDGFWEDMKEGYDDNLTLDRIDSNDNYYKENCRWISLTKQMRNRKMIKTNTSGATGVIKEEKRKGEYYWVARWYMLNGKLGRKGFSVNRLGNDLAFSQACEYRKQMIEQLNEMGAGYTETHGQ